MDFQVYDIAIVPLIVGMVALATGLGLPKKFAPVVAVALGVAVGIFYVAPGDVLQGVLAGTALGLSSVGLYSGAKNTAQGLKDGSESK